jgi:hypothetical protein
LATCVAVAPDNADDNAGETTAVGDGDGDGDLNCLPRDPEVDFSYAFEFGLDPSNPYADLDWTCTITAVDVSEGLDLLLDCPDAQEPVTIAVTATPGFVSPVFGGETIHLRYLVTGGWWFSTHLRLDIEGGGHFLTLIDGGLVPSNDLTFELPFVIEPVSGLCPSEPDECGNVERVALAFSIDGQPVELHDGSYSHIDAPPSTDVWVSTAEHYQIINCSDVADEWYRILIVNPG